jgi:hypothetical protein
VNAIKKIRAVSLDGKAHFSCRVLGQDWVTFRRSVIEAISHAM